MFPSLFEGSHERRRETGGAGLERMERGGINTTNTFFVSLKNLQKTV